MFCNSSSYFKENSILMYSIREIVGNAFFLLVSLLILADITKINHQYIFLVLTDKMCGTNSPRLFHIKKFLLGRKSYSQTHKKNNNIAIYKSITNFNLLTLSLFPV